MILQNITSIYEDYKLNWNQNIFVVCSNGFSKNWLLENNERTTVDLWPTQGAEG